MAKSRIAYIEEIQDKILNYIDYIDGNLLEDYFVRKELFNNKNQEVENQISVIMSLLDTNIVTKLTFDDGTISSFNWSGEINQQTMIDAGLYDNDQWTKNIINAVIGSGVTIIGASAFFGCSDLVTVTIPNSVTSIRDAAFFGCYNLASVTIPDSVTSIGNDAFYGCRSLTALTFEGKTRDQVETMANYSWEVDPEYIYPKDESTPSETYIIHFDANGGSGTMQDLTANVGESITLTPNAFTYTDHEFAGWSTDSIGQVIYSDEASVEDLAAVGETATLYAKWNEVTPIVRDHLSVDFFDGALDEGGEYVDTLVFESTGSTTDKLYPNQLASIYNQLAENDQGHTIFDGTTLKYGSNIFGFNDSLGFRTVTSPTVNFLIDKSDNSIQFINELYSTTKLSVYPIFE